MPKPLRKTHPQPPLYQGGAGGVNSVSEQAVTQYEDSLSISFTQMTDEIDPTQVPQAAVTQFEGALSIDYSQLTNAPTFATPLVPIVTGGAMSELIFDDDGDIILTPYVP